MSKLRLFIIDKLINYDPSPKSLIGRILNYIVDAQVKYETKKYG